MKSMKTLGAILALASVSMIAGCDNDSPSENSSGNNQALVATACGERAATILNGANENIGSVVVSNTDTQFLINIQMDPISGWLANEILAYVGVGEIPKSPEGYPDFTQFPVGQSYYPGVSSKLIVLDIATVCDGMVPCPYDLNVSIFVQASRPDGQGGTENTNGWAYGPNSTGCECYGVTFNYEFCGGEEESGCTLTQGYWKNHHQYARQRSQRLNWPAPMDELQFLCVGDNRTLLKILQDNPRGGNAYLILAHQYIAAQLNVASGASAPAQVNDALVDALPLLQTHCGQSVPASSADGQLMVILADVLDSYNNGLVGPGHCGGSAQ